MGLRWGGVDGVGDGKGRNEGAGVGGEQEGVGCG